MRVVSLVPSLTETLFDLGAGGDVAGITDFCIFPPGLQLPRLGGTKNPRVEEIRALAPDLVYMNSEENLRRHAEAIGAFARVHVSEPKSVEDVAALIGELGEIHGRRERAKELVDQLRAELHAFPPLPARGERAGVRGRPSQRGKAPHPDPLPVPGRGDVGMFTFACPIWKNPWMWCGGDTYVSRLVECAGGVNVLGERLRYPHVELKDVLALRPDVIFLPDEPYLFTQADAAAIGARTIGPFPGHLFTWHGTRTIQGLRFLRNEVPRPEAP
ncbi:MAG TPA: helical backbone metal receptor [Thermoanaerobaculia bacterium]|nr:helical backbone metal receptor [Thermoanaerobaculia bacterium]